MLVNANYDLMKSIDDRYQRASRLNSRDHYSIFYGPLRPSKLLMINANPGGTPDNYSTVDVMNGAHEYIEGRASGPTTANGAKILHHIIGSEDPETIRGIQVLNRFFRRSPMRPSASREAQYMEEARPFLEELITYIQPEVMLFGGDAGVDLFAKAHGGSAEGDSPVMGPNGPYEAVYFRQYELHLPYYRSIPAYSIYHPSKLNSVFRERVFPLLRTHLGSHAP